MRQQCCEQWWIKYERGLTLPKDFSIILSCIYTCTHFHDFHLSVWVEGVQGLKSHLKLVVCIRIRQRWGPYWNIWPMIQPCVSRTFFQPIIKRENVNLSWLFWNKPISLSLSFFLSLSLSFLFIASLHNCNTWTFFWVIWDNNVLLSIAFYVTLYTISHTLELGAQDECPHAWSSCTTYFDIQPQKPDTYMDLLWHL